MIRPGSDEAPEEGPITVTLAADLATKGGDAAFDAVYLLGHAANIFGLLSRGIAGGTMSADDPGVASLCEVSERAFRDMMLKEGEVLDLLGTTIRWQLKSRAEERRAAELHRQQEEARRAAQP